MTADLERRLHDELAELAASTRVAPDALERIVAGASARARRRRVAPVLVAGAVAVAVVLAAVVVTRDRRPLAVADLPATPPELAGTLLAEVHTVPCVGDCVDGTFRLPVTDLERMTRVSPERVLSPVVLPDGRYLENGSPDAAFLVDPARDVRLRLAVGWAESVAVLPDGGLVVVAPDDETQRTMVVEIDPANGAVVGRTDLPDGFHPVAVAAGPDGSLAVLDFDDRLLVVAPDGDQSEHDLGDELADLYGGLIGKPALSWSSGGLLALSLDHPEPYTGDPLGSEGWLMVVDPATGRVVATLEGWQGLAWSPDGRGLAAARRTGDRTSGVAVFWGPGLSERIDLGDTTMPVVPRYWLP